MSEESSWAPAPRRGGRRFDWGAAEAPAFGGIDAPVQEDGLDDLFEPAGDAPLPGTLGWGGPGSDTAPGTDDGLADLFGDDEAPAPLGAPLGADVPAPAAEVADSGLDDLFGDSEEAAEWPAPAAEAPTVVETDDTGSGLDDLFGDDDLVSVEEAPVAEAPVAEAPVETSGPEAVEPEAPAGDFWSSIPLPTKEELAVEAAAEATTESERKDEVAEEEAPIPSLTSLAGLTQRTASKAEPQKTEVPAVETPTQPQTEAPAGRSRLDLAARRRALEEASMGSDQSLIARDQIEMMEKYVVPDHIWSYVDRLLGYVSATPAVQVVINPFVLTRDRLLDAEQRRKLEDVIAPRMMDAGIMMHNPRDAQATFDLAYDELIGISVLGPLWRDNEITEVMVDGWDRVVVERKGRLVPTPIKFRDAQHAARVARDLASKISDRGLTPANPLVTAQLPGARVTFAYGSVVKSGLSISLRKFVDLLGMEKLLEFGALTPEMAEFLRQAVIGRANVLVSGGTGTGKTTQINALSQFIPDNERVITIEDAFELQLSNANVVALQTKEKASADDEVVITQDMLLVNTLRMRPDRVVVGEIREGKGAVVMLQAANTGHDGTMTTIHAQAPTVALNERLADLVMEVNHSPSEVVRRSVASAIDLVVQVTRKHGRRFISEIALVDRSCFTGGTIVPEPVFVGEVTSEGEVTFRHVGGIRPDTGLGMKLAEVGFDVSQWEPSA